MTSKERKRIVDCASEMNKRWGVSMRQCLAVAQAGGAVASAALPTPEKFDRMLAMYAPGCGSPTHVSGTNGGTMPCGGWLSWPDGKREQYFCGNCQPIKQ